MTNFQQQARLRKIIYLASIVALFTGSLIHRRLVIESQARELQLREVDRGEVELTASAVRLLLTGSRGMAVTALWAEVDKKQIRHKWNEVELLVNSITELQPYFITPWLFQSHNLAFNIAVENDRPRDKYYYISRGLDRLAAGERRNSVPGNPDLRYHMGLYLQMKIGTSDEKTTMRCLLDMSCIDPRERTNLDKFWTIEPGKGKVLSTEFLDFCRRHPRLIRRLREQLGYTPNQVINFLDENREVPNRFTEETTLAGKSVLKDPKQQWPILPPRRATARGFTPQDWPDATKPDFALTNESMDVFLVSRSWFLYAQESLPPPPAVPGNYITDPDTYKPEIHRIPRRPNIYIFRQTPARAASFHAEALQDEGWFDGQAWFIKGWFVDPVVKSPLMGEPVGESPIFHSGRAWARALQLTKDYGRHNNIYHETSEKRRLERQAEPFRRKYSLKAGEGSPLERDDVPPEFREGLVAHNKLFHSNFYRGLVNFDAHIYEAEGKGNPQAIIAFKLFTLAEPLRKSGESTITLYERNEATGAYDKKVYPLMQVYELAVDLLQNVMLNSPGVRRVATLQEEVYEFEIRYIRYYQDVHTDKLFKPLTLGMMHSGMFFVPPLYYQADHVAKLDKPLTLGLSQWAMLLHPPLFHLVDSTQEKKLFPLRDFGGFLTKEQQNKTHPLRDFRGPFDMLFALSSAKDADGSVKPFEDVEEQALKMAVLAWSGGPTPYLLLHPGLQPRLFSVITSRHAVVGPEWLPLVSSEAIRAVRLRYRGLPSIEQPQPAPK